MLHETIFNQEPRALEPASQDQRRKINFDLCRSIDLIKFSIVLDEMVKAGMHPNLAVLYKTQADALLQQIRSENNRIHGI